MSKRTFLFLQGLASPFFYRLARRLRAAGHDVLRINLSGADMVFWPERAINFRGSAQEWPDFVARVMRDRYVTDLVLFGDCRPYHRVALEVARHAGAIAHIFEEGYIRPNWITLEHGGTNGQFVDSARPEYDPRVGQRSIRAAAGAAPRQLFHAVDVGRHRKRPRRIVVAVVSALSLARHRASAAGVFRLDQAICART
jgi:hypothetical protein